MWTENHSSSRTWHATKETGYGSGHDRAGSPRRWPQGRSKVLRTPSAHDRKLRSGNTSSGTSSAVIDRGTSPCRVTSFERICCAREPSRPSDGKRGSAGTGTHQHPEFVPQQLHLRSGVDGTATVDWRVSQACGKLRRDRRKRTRRV